jgi:hypothetical protein
MNNESERIRNEVVVAKFEVHSRHVPKGNEQNQSGWLSSGPGFYLRTYSIRSRAVTLWTEKFRGFVLTNADLTFAYLDTFIVQYKLRALPHYIQMSGKCL